MSIRNVLLVLQVVLHVDINSQWSYSNNQVSVDSSDPVYQISSDFVVYGEVVTPVFNSTQSPDEGVYRCDINDVDNIFSHCSLICTPLLVSDQNLSMIVSCML